MKKKLTIITKISAILIIISIYWLSPGKVNAQDGGIIWGEPINISRSDLETSSDPFLLADPAGVVHLFWAEKTSKQTTKTPDTLMYALWDGNNWSEPIDIYLAPEEDGNQVVQYPHAVLDDNGIIHLVWLTQPNFPNFALFYSSVPANEANNAKAWKTPVMLAADLSGTEYSLDLQKDEDQNLHVVYSRVPVGDNVQELRTVTYLKSSDGGKTWTDPFNIHTIPDSRRGASNNRLLADEQGNLYTTWTEWDQTGNGQIVYFARSLNNGDSWEAPIAMTERFGQEYERDWNSIGLLEPGHLVSFYEGGWRAYRNVMYSYDQGETWSEPVDAFPGLIGENGFIKFARDSNNTLHIFFANRTREGNELQDGEGLWHSVWLGGENWSEPIHSSTDINMLNPQVAIINGNQIMIAWFVQADLEIIVMPGKIVDAPSVAPVPWFGSPVVPESEISATPIITPTVAATAQPSTPVPTNQQIIVDPSPTKSPNPSFDVAIGMGAALVAIFAILGIGKMISTLRKKR